ncbi:MAG: sulfatase [Nitrososphaeria archaeon]
MNNRYNVILVIIDTLRKDHVGCYGNEWIRTPNLDKLSKMSTIFDNAYPESLPTIPVRRALWTGNRVFPIREYMPRKGDEVLIPGWEPIPEHCITLSEVLSSKGYRSALITDTYHMFKPSMNFHRGFDEWIWIRGQEADHYRSKTVTFDPHKYLTDVMLFTEDERRRSLAEIIKEPRGKRAEAILSKYFANICERKNEEEYFAPKVFNEAIRWLRENKDAENFFLLVDSFDPHEPWDPPHKYVDIYDPGYEGKEIITPEYGKTDYLNEKELKHMRAHYAGEVTMVDKWFGRFYEVVEELDLFKNTIFIVISDHGHQLGEHEYTGKVPWGMWPELMDLVLFVKHPENIGVGKRVASFVYNIDIFSTILDFLGFKINWNVDSISFRRVIEGDGESFRDFVTCRFGDYVFYKDESYTLICKIDKSEAQLYDLRNDPRHEKNLASEDMEKVDELFGKILEDAGGELPKYELGTRVGAAWYVY